MSSSIQSSSPSYRPSFSEIASQPTFKVITTAAALAVTGLIIAGLLASGAGTLVVVIAGVVGIVASVALGIRRDDIIEKFQKHVTQTVAPPFGEGKSTNFHSSAALRIFDSTQNSV